MQFLIRAHPPAVTKAACREFDAQLSTCLFEKLELPIDPVALLQMNLPLSQHGFGLALTSITAPAAYLSSIASSAALFSPSLRESKDGSFSPRLTPTPLQTEANRAILGNRSIPMAQHVHFAISLLNTMAASSSPPLAFPKSIQHFWEIAHEPKKGMQKDISSFLHSHCLLAISQHLLSNNKKERLATLLLAGAQKAHLWLSSLPLEDSLSLENDVFTTAAAMRLGISPFPSLPTTCACKQPLSSFLHFLSCKLLVSKSMTSRHDMVVKAVSSIADYTFTLATIEPPNTHLPSNSSRRADIRFDLQTIPNIITDISIISPTAPSYIDSILNQSLLRAISSHDFKSLAELVKKNTMSSLHWADARKESKHANDAQAQGARFQPFILSSFGGWTDKALKMIDSIESHSVPLSGFASSRFLVKRRIACALQRGNALVLRQGYFLSVRGKNT